MNHKDTIEFDGKEITIEDILKKQTKVIVIGLHFKVDRLNEKIKDIPDKVEKNSKDIANLTGSICVALPLISIIVGLAVYLICFALRI